MLTLVMGALHHASTSRSQVPPGTELAKRPAYTRIQYQRGFNMSPNSIQKFDLLPAVEVEEAQPGDPPVIRRTVLEEKRQCREIRDATHKDTVGMSPSS
jgi:hypothetical protein